MVSAPDYVQERFAARKSDTPAMSENECDAITHALGNAMISPTDITLKSRTLPSGTPMLLASVEVPREWVLNAQTALQKEGLVNGEIRRNGTTLGFSLSERGAHYFTALELMPRATAAGRKSDKIFTRSDAAEIMESLRGFFEVLKKTGN